VKEAGDFETKRGAIMEGIEPNQLIVLFGRIDANMDCYSLSEYFTELPQLDRAELQVGEKVLFRLSIQFI
jgi:hypothetical protein